jgi:hypothetical protein
MATQVLERISSTSLVELEHRTLDNMFDDLGHHILNNSLDAASLEQVISTRCIPNELPTDIKSFKKFVRQAWVKTLLHTFPVQTGYPLQETEYEEGYLEAKQQYYTSDDWGKFKVITRIKDPSRNEDTSKENQLNFSKNVISGLYTYADGLYKTPIALVVSSGDPFNEQEQRKEMRGFVKALYNGMRPYFFEVNWKTENQGSDSLGLQILQEDYRRLVIPYNPQVNQLATKLLYRRTVPT